MKRFFSSFLPLAVSLLLWALWIDSGDAGIGPAIVYLYLQFGLAVRALCARKDLPLPDVYAQILYRALTAVPVYLCFRTWFQAFEIALLIGVVLLLTVPDLRRAMNRGDPPENHDSNRGTKSFLRAFAPLVFPLLFWIGCIWDGARHLGWTVAYFYIVFSAAVHALCARKDLPLPDVYAQILYRALTAVPVAVCFRLWMTSSIYGLLLIIVLLFAGLDLRAAMRRGDALAEDCQ